VLLNLLMVRFKISLPSKRFSLLPISKFALHPTSNPIVTVFSGMLSVFSTLQTRLAKLTVLL
jgi:hypothetical protein